jgi:hypothetical protein
MDVLLHLIRAWSRRARVQLSLRWLFMGVTGGLAVALIVAIVARLYPLASVPVLETVAFVNLAAGTVFTLLWPWLQTARTTPAGWARRFDQQFNLKERLSTALELGDGIVVIRDDAMRQRQYSDAQSVATRLDVKKLLPLRIPVRHVLLAASLAFVLLFALYLPNPQQQVLANRQQLHQVLDQQMKQLDEARQLVEQSTTLSAEQKAQAIQALDEAQQALSDPNATPESAMAAINDAQSKLDALQDQAAAQQQEDLQRSGQSLPPDQTTNPLAHSLANGDFDQAAQDMRELTKPGGQSLNEEQRQNAADQLEQLARGIQNSDPATAQKLREAAQQLREGNPDAAQKNLDEAAQALEKADQAKAASEEMNKAQASLDEARRAVGQGNQDAQSGAQADNPADGNAEGAQAGQQGESEQDKSGQAGAGQAEAGSPDQGGQGADVAQAGQSGDADGPANLNGAPSSAHHEDTGSDDSVYAPQRVGGDGQQVGLPDQNPLNAPNPNGRPNPGVDNSSTVPYQQVYRDYAKVADEALQSGQVPPGMRDYVRDYFSSLDPNGKK